MAHENNPIGMSILQQVTELGGHTTDSDRDSAIRLLAELEDTLSSGSIIAVDPDDLAMARHVIQYPRPRPFEELSPEERMTLAHMIYDRGISASDPQELIEELGQPVLRLTWEFVAKCTVRFAGPMRSFSRILEVAARDLTIDPPLEAVRHLKEVFGPMEELYNIGGMDEDETLAAVANYVDHGIWPDPSAY